MRILHIDEQTGWRGGEQQASYLIAGLVRRGHECIIAGRPGSEFLKRDHGAPDAPRLSLPMRGEADVISAWRLAASARKYGIDILHAHSSHAHALAILARALGAHAKVVVTRRVDFVPKNHLFNRWKYRSPDFTVAISGLVQRILTRIGVPESRLRVVYSSIDPARFDVEPLPRAAFGVPDDVPLLGNVAALVGHKDHATLLSAMPAVLKAIPQLHLIIAGEGPLRPHLESQIATLGLGHAVHLLGYRNDVPQLLRTMDAFVMSSKEEGLGTSILDAMCCGIPVIATAGGAIPEIVKPGDTGYLAEARNPDSLAREIIIAFGNPLEMKRRAECARSMVSESFSVDSMVEDYLRIYMQLM
ncbi:MAG: hypothetical protein AMXMBFR84_18040 [Candidatus Hydrogenedentota bacterium]